MSTPNKAQQMAAKLTARSYATWRMAGMKCATCDGAIEATNVQTETGKPADIVFTPHSALRCAKCRTIIDPHPLATQRGEAPPPATEPTVPPPPQLPDSPRLTGTFSALCTRVIDGDTLECLVSLPFSIFTRQVIRLNAYDAPEAAEPGGHAATLAALQLCNNTRLTLTCYPIEEKYGRIIADVRLPDGRDYADVMKSLGLVKKPQTLEEQTP